MHSAIKTALIGGTSLLESSRFKEAQRISVETSFGEVPLLETAGGLLFLQRHGLESYTQPHRINHHANIEALQRSGVERILSVGSVGSLKRKIIPGSFVVPDDFYAPSVNPSYYEDERGHRVAEFHPVWRRQILQLWEETGRPMPRDGGVYWQTRGPRFETRAEIKAHRPFAHIVGMTIASECILASEKEIPYAAICMADNYANGISPQRLSYDAFRTQVRDNQSGLVATLEDLLTAMMDDGMGQGGY
ncbi:MAG: MTAP family purine nucleoside phosphorylase [Magnetococcales bacterium]|nr:MTAP family purine nucleoside phosphorylase [Magnetococcales bacterium]